MEVILWTVIGFFSGAVPYSILIGRIVGGLDIRDYGEDANPGAANVGKSLGPVWAGLAGLLDGLKAAIPVGIAHFVLGITGWGLVPIALAPVLGHAYSPFLRFKGGKAVAATFGTWSGLTIGVAPTLMGLLLGVWFAVLKVSGWSVLAMWGCFGLFVLLYYRSPVWMVIWAGNLVVWIIKYRDDLREPLAVREGLLNRASRLLGREAPAP
ncbi:MAG: hypothetical protein GYB64_12235 [Chloroflexi bacterium]|nr:hypothetical protein [Chloroflexota bacterium]